jgi:hypothetical protein
MQERARSRSRPLSACLAATGGKAQIVAHEFREKTPQANHDRAARELQSLRTALSAAAVDVAHVPFLAAGDASPRQKTVTEAMRAIYSSVDVEIRR